jgi:hypothetical protein
MIETGAGFWNPLAMAAVFAVVAIAVLIARHFGNGRAGKDTLQAMPFFSGNAAKDVRIGPENMYWGFFEEMRGYYGAMKAMHSGIVNDYFFWLVLVMVAMAALFIFGGALWA